MAKPQQNWGLLPLLTRWASIWTMPNTASPKSEPPCESAVYTLVRATILGHPPQKTAPRGGGGLVWYMYVIILWPASSLFRELACPLFNTNTLPVPAMSDHQIGHIGNRGKQTPLDPM